MILIYYLNFSNLYSHEKIKLYSHETLNPQAKYFATCEKMLFPLSAKTFFDFGKISYWFSIFHSFFVKNLMMHALIYWHLILMQIFPCLALSEAAIFEYCQVNILSYGRSV